MVAIANVGQNGVRLQPSAEADHIYSHGTVRLHPNALVRGDIFAKALDAKPNAMIEGAFDSSRQLDPKQTTVVQIQFPAATVLDISIGPHQSRALSPGRYGHLSVSPNASVTIGSGKYYFETIALSPNSAVRAEETTGAAYLFVKQTDKLSARWEAPAGFDLVLIQTEAGSIAIDTPFRGVVLAPNAALHLKDGPHRGSFLGKDVYLGAKAEVVYEPPNVLAPIASPPERDLQECANAIRPRMDLPEHERERLFQRDIARFCTMPGVSECLIDLTSRVNVDYALAAGALFTDQFTPAQYLAVVRDRTRKLRAAEDDPVLAQALCSEADTDGDLVPDRLDKCPNTPELTHTDDDGCTDPNLPPAPNPDWVREALQHGGFIINPACSGALLMPKIPAGAFYRPANVQLGSFILSGRVTNQPPGCPVWYLFDIEEEPTGQDIRRYTVAFMDREEITAFVGRPRPVPSGFIQFNTRPTDTGTRGMLGRPGGRRLRFRVQAMNGAGMKSGWSAWKRTTCDDCYALGLKCLSCK